MDKPKSTPKSTYGRYEITTESPAATIFKQSGGDAFVNAIADAVAERLEYKHNLHCRVLDIEAAAKYLSLSEDAVRDLVSTGKLRAVRPTRKLQFDILDLNRLVEQSKAS